MLAQVTGLNLGYGDPPCFLPLFLSRAFISSSFIAFFNLSSSLNPCKCCSCSSFSIFLLNVFLFLIHFLFILLLLSLYFSFLSYLSNSCFVATFVLVFLLFLRFSISAAAFLRLLFLFSISFIYALFLASFLPCSPYLPDLPLPISTVLVRVILSFFFSLSR